MNDMRGIEFHPVIEGLKARGEAPGISPVQMFQPCNGGTWHRKLLGAEWRAEGVPPLQGGGKCFWDMPTQGFTLGYHIAGFQPDAIAALKGRHVTAQPEGPGKGTPPPFFHKPCKGGTRDAESAEVLGNIKALL